MRYAVVALLLLVACSSGLSDAEQAWCGSHMDAVLAATGPLDINSVEHREDTGDPIYKDLDKQMAEGIAREQGFAEANNGVGAVESTSPDNTPEPIPTYDPDAERWPTYKWGGFTTLTADWYKQEDWPRACKAAYEGR